MEIGGLIVGLGNPGAEYQGTRHNFGFMVIEALLAAFDHTAPPARLSGQKDPFALWRVSTLDSKGIRKDWFLAMPLCYMNRSGEPVQRIASYYRIDAEQIFVLHDELDLPLGRMKLKKGGGNAGHNGLKSIQQVLGTPDFFRLRLGIGKPPGQNGASWVLSRFTPDQKDALEKTMNAAAEGVMIFMRQGPRKAQQFCNGFALPSSGTETTGPPDTH